MGALDTHFWLPVSQIWVLVPPSTQPCPVNPMFLANIMMHYLSSSWLLEAVAWCRSASKPWPKLVLTHYINCSGKNYHLWNLRTNIEVSLQRNLLENVVCTTAAIFIQVSMSLVVPAIFWCLESDFSLSNNVMHPLELGQGDLEAGFNIVRDILSKDLGKP